MLLLIWTELTQQAVLEEDVFFSESYLRYGLVGSVSQCAECRRYQVVGKIQNPGIFSRIKTGHGAGIKPKRLCSVHGVSQGEIDLAFCPFQLYLRRHASDHPFGYVGQPVTHLIGHSGFLHEPADFVYEGVHVAVGTENQQVGTARDLSLVECCRKQLFFEFAVSNNLNLPGLDVHRGWRAA